MVEKQKLKQPKALNKNLVVNFKPASMEIQEINLSFKTDPPDYISPEKWKKLTEINFSKIAPLLEALRKYDEGH